MSRPEGYFPATGMPDPDWWSVLWPEPKGVLSALGVGPGMVALDLCCGDGLFTVPLAEVLDGAVYGVDIDPAMLAEAYAALERAHCTARDLICGDARDLEELLPEKVDYVLIANTFHGVPDQTSLAEAVAAVLSPGGRFAVINWHAMPREDTVVLGKARGPGSELRMSPETVRRVVEPAGFVFESLVELPPFHYGVVFRRAA